MLPNLFCTALTALNRCCEAPLGTIGLTGSRIESELATRPAGCALWRPENMKLFARDCNGLTAALALDPFFVSTLPFLLPDDVRLSSSLLEK